ncbi:hypothetical protein GWI33_009866, partial [Rhynchophorus ferrugineus]
MKVYPIPQSAISYHPILSYPIFHSANSPVPKPPATLDKISGSDKGGA